MILDDPKTRKIEFISAEALIFNHAAKYKHLKNLEIGVLHDQIKKCICIRFYLAKAIKSSHALSVDDLGTVLLVLLLGDPLALEGGETGESRSSSPD